MRHFNSPKKTMYVANSPDKFYTGVKINQQEFKKEI